MKRITKKRIRKKIIAFLLIFDVVFGWIYFSSTRLILDNAGEYFKSNISNCSYYAVEECLNKEVDFSAVCVIERDESGQVALIKTDSVYLNYIVKKLSLDCYEYMQEVVDSGVKIPAGVFTGVKLLSGIGPSVRIKMLNTLSVECEILRTFTQAGINQTRQTLSAIISTEIILFAPFYKEKYNGKIEIVLSDTIIVGKVPSTYLNATVLASEIKGEYKE